MKTVLYTPKKVLYFVGLLICLVLSCCISSCSTIAQELANSLPDSGFQSFEYHRSASGWTKDIEAKNGAINDGILTIESLIFKSNYPFVTFDVKIEGYTQTVKEDD